MKRVLIVQDKPQEWADALKLGFYDGLKQQGLVVGTDVVVVPMSAVGDPQALAGLAQATAREKADLVYTLGTQATQEIARTVKDKPIIFGAVTDPVAAGLYEGDLSNPKSDITGTQDLWPYPAQFDLIKRLVPGTKRVGIIYNSSEVNSQVSVQHIKDECRKRGIELVERTVTTEAQIALATAGVLGSKVDVLFIPADNTAQTSANVIIAACTKAKTPVFTGIPGIVESGALGTVGTNYYELGKVNAAQAAEILKGKQAKQIPVAIADKGDLYLNLKTAAKLGLTVPEELVKQAVAVYK